MGVPETPRGNDDAFESVTDEQVENAIVRAVLGGRDGLAETLRDVLQRRQRVRAGNVHTLPVKGSKGR